MKIGIDVRCFAQGKNTGVEEYTKKILVEIFEYDKENEYILFFNAWKKQYIDFSWIESYKKVSIKKYSLPNKLLNFSLWFLQYPKLDKLCGGVDVFFMPNSNFCAFSKKTKLFLTVHDLSFVHYKKTFSWKRRIWHFFVNPRLLIKKAHHIFAVSEATKSDILITYGINDEKITVTKNGFTTIKKKYTRNSIEVVKIKEKYKLPYKFILYFGTIEPRKNIVGIIQAYDNLREISKESIHKLVIAGAKGWHEEEINNAIESAKFSNDIIIITNVSKSEKEAIYTLASVFVYPSFFEGFGFPPLEAMHADVPVITSNVTSLPEIVGKNAIMINPMQKSELVIALHSIITQNELQNILVKQSKQQIDKFHWSSAAMLCIKNITANK